MAERLLLTSRKSIPGGHCWCCCGGFRRVSKRRERRSGEAWTFWTKPNSISFQAVECSGFEPVGSGRTWPLSLFFHDCSSVMFFIFNFHHAVDFNTFRFWMSFIVAAMLAYVRVFVFRRKTTDRFHDDFLCRWRCTVAKTCIYLIMVQLCAHDCCLWVNGTEWTFVRCTVLVFRGI